MALRDLRRNGRLELEASVAPDARLWSAAGLTLGAAVRLVATVTASGSGQVVLTGRVSARLIHDCRRCLARVEADLEQPVEFRWRWAMPRSVDRGGAGAGDDGEVRLLEPNAAEIDVGEALREELVLTAPAYVVCSERCEGLCPHCGTNLNEATCDCATDEPDPRWDALRALYKR